MSEETQLNTHEGGVKITTNNVPRNLLSWDELTAKEQKEFDYLNGLLDEQISADFFRYKGSVYHVQDAESKWHSGSDPFDPFPEWDGWYSETFFSGVIFKYADREYNSVIVGRYYS